MTNETARVMELLKRFNDGKKVCIDALKNDLLWEGKSEKTIRRDLDVIKSYFKDSFELIRGEKGCYKAITKESFDNFLSKNNLSLMVQTFNIAQRSDLFKSLDINEGDKRILESKVKEVSKLYEFKNKPFENKIDDLVVFQKLESSIKNQKYIVLEYQEGKNLKTYEVKPYKIVFINEVFYLACEVDNDYMFSMFRISNIKNITDTKKTYQKNLDIDDFIKDMQTSFSTYKPNYKLYLIEVVLEVAKEKARYFKAKNFLKSQTILEEKPEGNLLVSYKITQELEIEELIKRWLPHVRVIKPLPLKERIENELRGYLGLG